MNITVAFHGIQRLCMEAAPLIYYVEENPVYSAKFDAILTVVESADIVVISSVITLTEVLTQPLKLRDLRLVTEYRDILLHNGQFQLLPVTQAIAEKAAELRARYNLRTPDALHVATALESDCDAFLTNDMGIKRVTEITVLVLDELELDTRT